MRRRLLAPLVLVALLAPSLMTARADGPTTLYFHSLLPVSKVEEAAALAGGPAPTMDSTPPATPVVKVGLTTPLANTAFRGNPLGAFWVGNTIGEVSDPVLHLFAAGVPDEKLIVSLFDGGPLGAATPLASVTVTLDPGTLEYTVPFGSAPTAFRNGMVVGVFAESAVVPILFDSTVFPSGVSFKLGPLPTVPPIDDITSLVFRGVDLLAANAGTGEIVTLDPETFAITRVVGHGLVPGGFARGVTGLAVDGDGKLYASIADTGEVLSSAPDGATGAYGRGLGTPMGIAFDSSGNAYVADRAGNRVVKLAKTVDKNGHTWRKQSVLATFSAGAYGVALSPTGSLAVSTQKDGKVYSVNTSTGAATQLLDLPDADSAESLAYDTAGNLYVGDGKAGKLLKLDTEGATTTAATGLGGPLALAFRPGTGTLLVATQGEGRSAGDAVIAIDVGGTGLALAAPMGLAAPQKVTPRAWLHRGVAPVVATKAGAGAARPVFPKDFDFSSQPEATARYTGANAVEPTLGIQNDGDIYMVESRNPCSVTLGQVVCGRSELHRSGDQGLHWNQITPDTDTGFELPPVSGDPYLYVDTATSRVYSVDLTAACTYVWYSDDDGQTWTPNPLGCGFPPIDHQTIVASVPRTVKTTGYPHVLTLCSNVNGLSQASPCQRSLDGGTTWTFTAFAYNGLATTDPDCGGGLTSHLATDKDGRLFLPRVSSTNACLAISEDDGTTWNVKKIAPFGGADHEGRLAADSDGNLFYTWIATDRLPYLITSTDHGATWSAPKMIAPPGVTVTNQPAIAAGGPGKIVVSYMGSTNDYGYPTNFMGLASWNAYLTTATDALGADPVFTTTTANPLTDPIKRQDCGPGRCGLIFDFLDVRIDAQGRPWAAFGDMCTDACVGDRTFATSFTFAKGFVAPFAVGSNLRGDTPLPRLKGTATSGFFGGGESFAL